MGILVRQDAPMVEPLNAEQKTLDCAWCLEERDEKPEAEASHGICRPHADRMLLNYYWQRLQSVPSYVETQASLFAKEEE